MNYQRVIYQRGAPLSGSVWVSPPLFVRFGYQLARGIGAGLIAFALLGVGFSLAPIVRSELAYWRLDKNKAAHEQSIEKFMAMQTVDRVLAVQDEAKSYGVNSYFSVVIPKIEAQATIQANVDPGNEKEYAVALERGVAHSKGTYFPGQGKLVYLFAHSTNSPFNAVRLNAVFYLLRKLEPNDEIIVYFADAKYVYRVREIVVTQADDVSWLTGDYGAETLILQTCTPPGTTWKRLLVIAEPVPGL